MCCNLQLRLCGSVLTNSPNQFLPPTVDRACTNCSSSCTRPATVINTFTRSHCSSGLSYFCSHICSWSVIDHSEITCRKQPCRLETGIARSHPRGRKLFRGDRRLRLELAPWKYLPRCSSHTPQQIAPPFLVSSQRTFLIYPFITLPYPHTDFRSFHFIAKDSQFPIASDFGYSL